MRPRGPHPAHKEPPVITAEAGSTPRRRTHDALLKDIETDLRSDKIKVGDRLPGERTLAQTYGISRASVREAIRVLDAMGILRSSVGSGPTSGAIVVSNPSAGLSSALRLHVARPPAAGGGHCRDTHPTRDVDRTGRGEPRRR
ncbi:FadR/GntR family transcriptional regulator [Arthrobacter sp. VKM Ac-2550]|uniref:FadR/GntR family transcriptional regulator n=1 Tax=Crystallibacter permensis TaxID=1938888 RepID=UPI0029CAB376|nr:GntR family transcriptional regulator [Arthrobacter sp. VKM Ac-2550]